MMSLPNRCSKTSLNSHCTVQDREHSGETCKYTMSGKALISSDELAMVKVTLALISLAGLSPTDSR